MQKDWLWVETKKKKNKEKKKRNFMKFTDWCVMATLPEFLQISRISLGERLVFQEFSENMSKFQESIETLHLRFITIKAKLSRQGHHPLSNPNFMAKFWLFFMNKVELIGRWYSLLPVHIIIHMSTFCDTVVAGSIPTTAHVLSKIFYLHFPQSSLVQNRHW